MMKSFTVASFWDTLNELPEEVQNISRKKFIIWRDNPFHPSLQFKCVNSAHNIWSVRITRDYRALGIMDDNNVVWYWVGSHKQYEKLIKQSR